MTTLSPAQPVLYPPRCPTWCAGVHPAILALDNDPAADHLDAAEVVQHALDLTDRATAAALVVSLAADETHPASTQTPPAPRPRLFVYLPPDHDSRGASPAQLRAWAHALVAAADAADHHLNNAG